MENHLKIKKANRLIAVLVALVMIAAGFSFTAVNTYATEGSYDPTQNGTVFTKLDAAEQPALAFYGSLVNNGVGATKAYKYLKRDQLASIVSEAAAKAIFTNGTDLYGENIEYSSINNYPKYELTTATKALKLKGVAQTLGVNTTGTVNLTTTAADAYKITVDDIFKERNKYDVDGNFVNTVPAILSLGDTTDSPKLMIGQNDRADRNKSSWNRNVKTVCFGEQGAAFTLKINSSENRDVSWGDILGETAYESEYDYMSKAGEKTEILKGVKLSDLLAAKGIDIKTLDSALIKCSDGDGRILQNAELAKCFVAYESKSGSAYNTISSDTDLRLYCPGTSSGEVVAKHITGLEFTSTTKVPKNVKAARDGYNSIKLSWSKIGDATGYKIYRASSKSGTYTHIKTISNNTTVSYTDKGLKTGNRYYYKMISYNTPFYNTYESDFSEIVSAVPTLSKIKNVKAVAYKGKKAKISWSKAAGASGYVVYRATKKAGKYKAVKTVSKKYAYAWNTKLRAGKYYYYKVRAYRNVSGKKVYGEISAYRVVKAKK